MDSAVIVHRGVDAEGYHLSPRSSCCGAGVVTQVRGQFGRIIGPFVPVWDELLEYVNPRCGSCNRSLDGTWRA